MPDDHGISDAVNEVVKNLAAIPVYLAGQMPRTGLGWCASCVMIYMGEVASDEMMQEEVKNGHINAMQHGMSFFCFPLPDRDELQLQPAVTVGPSWAYRIEANTPDGWAYPELPVCWTHIKGIMPNRMSGSQKAVESNLIAGKDFRYKRRSREG